MHRDLKLENFVFNEKSENNFELKLIDFGLSEKFSSDSDKFKSIAGNLRIYFKLFFNNIFIKIRYLYVYSS